MLLRSLLRFVVLRGSRPLRADLFERLRHGPVVGRPLERLDETRFRLGVTPLTAVDAGHLHIRLDERGISIRGITARRMNLEQAFIQLVNKEAR